MTEFRKYYPVEFERDLLKFMKQIPIVGNKHYNNEEHRIQYFYLTPNYNYLDVFSKDKQILFIVALFWSVLIDQVFYTYFKCDYSIFQKKTLYPKFIGNCTAPSLMSSQCGHNQHPLLILNAVNDYSDKGNLIESDRKIFKNDEVQVPRKSIEIVGLVDKTKDQIKREIVTYLKKSHPNINADYFWSLCEREF